MGIFKKPMLIFAAAKAVLYLKVFFSILEWAWLSEKQYPLSE